AVSPSRQANPWLGPARSTTPYAGGQQNRARPILSPQACCDQRRLFRWARWGPHISEGPTRGGPYSATQLRYLTLPSLFSSPAPVEGPPPIGRRPYRLYSMWRTKRNPQTERPERGGTCCV